MQDKGGVALAAALSLCGRYTEAAEPAAAS